MENYYAISRKIIGVLAVLISFIALINEDISMKIVVTVFVFFIALATSFLTTPISKRIIKVGDGIESKCLRRLFYFIILPLTLLVAYIIYMLIMFVFDCSSASVNAAVLTVFLYTATTIIVIVPYIQVLIVLMCRMIMKD